MGPQLSQAEEGQTPSAVYLAKVILLFLHLDILSDLATLYKHSKEVNEIFLVSLLALELGLLLSLRKVAPRIFPVKGTTWK